MKKVLIVTIMILIACCGVLRSAPGNLNPNLIPAECSWIFHFDQTVFAKTKLFALINKNLTSNPQQKKPFYIEDLHIDVAKDLKYFTALGIEKPNHDDYVLLVYQGRYDKNAILKDLKKEEKLNKTMIDGMEVYSWQKDAHAIFPQNDMFVFWDKDSAVNDVVALVKGKGKTIAPSSPLLKALNDAPAAAFARSATLKCSDLVKHVQKTMVLSNTSMAFLIALEERDALSLYVKMTTESAAMAQNLQQVLTGVLAIARMKLNDNDQNSWQNLLNSMQLSTEGKILKVTFICPVEKIAAIVQDMNAKKEQSKSPVKKSAAPKKSIKK